MGLFWFHHSRGQGHGPFVEWVCSWVLRVLRVGECSTITGNSERCESLRWSTVQHEVFKRFGTLVVRKRKPIWWAFFKIPQVWQGCTCPKKVLLPRQLESAISQLHGCTSQTERCTSWPDLKIADQELDRGVHVENIYVKRPKRLAGLRCLAES